MELSTTQRLQLVLEKLHKIKLKMDGWYSNGQYRLTHNRQYPISRGYKDMLGEAPRIPAAELIWNSITMPKHRFLLWLASLGRLLTKDRLVKLGISCDNIRCELCDDDESEDAKHLFCTCTWTRTVWDIMHNWTGTMWQHEGIQADLLKINQKHWCKFQKEAVAAVYGAVIYLIWTARNQKIFKGRVIDSRFIIQQAKNVIKERIDIVRSSKRGRRCARLIEVLCN